MTTRSRIVAAPLAAVATPADACTVLKVRWLTGVGENGFRMPVDNQLVFRKAEALVTVNFARVANQRELDSSQIARMIDSRLQ